MGKHFISSIVQNAFILGVATAMFFASSGLTILASAFEARVVSVTARIEPPPPQYGAFENISFDLGSIDKTDSASVTPAFHKEQPEEYDEEQPPLQPLSDSFGGQEPLELEMEGLEESHEPGDTTETESTKIEEGRTDEGEGIGQGEESSQAPVAHDQEDELPMETEEEENAFVPGETFDEELALSGQDDTEEVEEPIEEQE